MIIKDLEELRAVTPKLQFLPPPNEDVDAWVVFAIQFPKAWRKFVRAWQTCDSPVLADTAFTACIICGKMIAHKGLGAHCARAHAQYRLARTFCTDDGICPDCHVQFPSRLRCMHHIHHATDACLSALVAGHCEPLPHEEVLRLDQIDAKRRNCLRKAGRSYLANS